MNHKPFLLQFVERHYNTSSQQCGLAWSSKRATSQQQQHHKLCQITWRISDVTARSAAKNKRRYVAKSQISSWGLSTLSVCSFRRLQIRHRQSSREELTPNATMDATTELVVEVVEALEVDPTFAVSRIYKEGLRRKWVGEAGNATQRQ